MLRLHATMWNGANVFEACLSMVQAPPPLQMADILGCAHSVKNASCGFRKVRVVCCEVGGGGGVLIPN